MLFLPIILIFASSTLATVIPLDSDNEGNLMVEMRGGLRSHRIVFTSSSRSYRPYEEYWGELDIIREDYNISLVSGIDNSFSFNFLSHMHEFHAFRRRDSILGIGPGGDFFLAAGGSVSVVRSTISHSGYLVLNVTGTDFVENYCASDSSVLIPLLRPEFAWGDSKSLYGIIQVGETRQSDSVFEIEITDGDNLVGLPYLMYPNLYAALGTWRVVSENERPRFEDCQSVISRLPQIDIVFSRSQNSLEPAGIIRLAPEDYVRHIDEDTCELLIVNSHSSHLTLNPLLLPDVNIRIENDAITICDSN